MKPSWIKAARFAGLDPDDTQMTLMDRYRVWLTTEAAPAGGIGPGEIERLDWRHLADSVLFASQIPPGTELVWDLGTGVGLPGVPLAICLPAVEFLLIDRSGRRIDLVRRVVRILALENCQVVHGELDTLAGSTEVIVSRASLPPDELLPVAERHLAPGGVAIMAGSWQQRPEHEGWTAIEIPEHVLDQMVWLLIMRRQ